MDWTTILGLFARHALTTAAGALAVHGYLATDATTKEQFVAGGMLGAGILWSVAQKYGKVLVDKYAAKSAGLVNK